MSDFHQEYQEGFDTLGDVSTIFYKFFSALSVKIRGQEVEIRFGRGIVDEDVPLQTAEKFREYLKEQREWIREQGKDANPKELKRRLWWVVTKIIDLGIFTNSEQKSVMIWLDICLDMITNP